MEKQTIETAEGQARRKRLWLSPHGILQFFTPLSHRNFRLLWVGRNLSRLGDSVYEIALGWTIYTLTGSSAAMGLVLATYTVLQVVFALFGGAVGDRMSRRRLLLIADASAGIITGLLALLVALKLVSLPVFILVAAGLGIVSAFALPAIGSLLGTTVPREDLHSANALDSATFSLMTLVGPAVGGLLVALNAVVAFGFDALTFGASFLSLLSLQEEGASGTFEGLHLKDLADGLRYTVRHPWLRWLVGMSVVANVACIAPFYVLLPQRVTILHLDAGSYGLTLAAQGVGAIIASGIFGYLKRFPWTGGLLFASASCLGIATVLLAIAANQLTILIAGGVIGLSACATTIENYLIQSRVGESYQSRVMSIMMVSSFALLPLAYAGAGLLAARIGASLVLLTGGSALVLVCMAALCSPSVRALRAVHSEITSEEKRP